MHKVLGSIPPWTRCCTLASKDLGQRKLVYRVKLSHHVAAINVADSDIDARSDLLWWVVQRVELA